ncbi:MAG: hypothetical protein JWR32_6038 [Mycobacterium sp.]|nr:hypothetical protein [Mycobacterium sp.]
MTGGARDPVAGVNATGDPAAGANATGDPAAGVDALVAAIHPNVSGPGVEAGDAVLVTGPWLAGSSSTLVELRERMPEQTFVEAHELDAGESPVAVVFVVSALAPLTDSDCALLDTAAANTDLVIGAVSKIDVHRNWRDVLAADRAALTEHNHRYRDVEWVGVAAAPELGEAMFDELVDVLRRGLAEAELVRRNRLRTWETRLQGAMRRHDDDTAGAGREARMAALRDRRREMLGRRRLTKSERTIALRSQIQQARVQLTYFARNRCTSVRSELQEDASGMTRRRMPSFEGYVRGRIDEVIGEVGAGVAEHLGDVATELGLTPLASAPPPESPPVALPPLKSRRLQTRLMMLLGAGLGLGVALILSRPFADLAPAYTAAGLAAGAVVGMGLAAWVVGTRGLLHDRAVLDRWVAEVIGELRAVLERHVAERVLGAETALSAEQAEHDEVEADNVADQVAGIDAELREHGVAAARAATLRNRERPHLQRALDAVQAELDGGTAGAETSPS